MFIFLFLNSAQADELDVNAQLFRPSLDSRYFLWINETGFTEDNAFLFKGVLSYASRPLVYTGYDETQIDFLHSVSQLDLLRPIYRSTTNYGHFAKDNLPWENTSKADDLRSSVS